jgi:hypothetical protein
VWTLYEKDRKRICKEKTWRVRIFPVRDGGRVVLASFLIVDF